MHPTDGLARIQSMDSFKRLMNMLPSPPFAGDLLEARSMRRIRLERKRQAKRQSMIFMAGALSSCAALVAVIVPVWQSMLSSGFLDYLSLMFAGDGAALAYWHEWSLAILESLPFLGMAVALSVLGALIWSSARVISISRQFRAL